MPTYNGTAGNDTITGDQAGDAQDVIIGLDGNDTLSGGALYDQLYGGSGNDGLYGGSGDDALYGGLGVDGYYGGDGSDSFSIYYDESNPIEAGETLSGGAGDDVIDISGASLYTGPGDYTIDISALNIDDTVERIQVYAYYIEDDFWLIDYNLGLTAAQLGNFSKITVFDAEIHLTTGGTADLTGADIETTAILLNDAGNTLVLTGVDSQGVAVAGGAAADTASVASRTTAFRAMAEMTL